MQNASRCLELSVELQPLSKIIFIDAGNVFNPYYIHRNFRSQINTREALENIRISRPFTIYQLRSLISHELENQLNSNFKIIIIPCIDDLFYGDSLDRIETKEVFKQTIERLKEVIEKKNAQCHISFIGKYYKKIYESSFSETLI